MASFICKTNIWRLMYIEVKVSPQLMLAGEVKIRLAYQNEGKSAVGTWNTRRTLFSDTAYFSSAFHNGLKIIAQIVHGADVGT
jgi:hypothetical protein